MNSGEFFPQPSCPLTASSVGHRSAPLLCRASCSSPFLSPAPRPLPSRSNKERAAAPVAPVSHTGQLGTGTMGWQLRLGTGWTQSPRAAPLQQAGWHSRRSAAKTSAIAFVCLATLCFSRADFASGAALVLIRNPLLF